MPVTYLGDLMDRQSEQIDYEAPDLIAHRNKVSRKVAGRAGRVQNRLFLLECEQMNQFVSDLCGHLGDFVLGKTDQPVTDGDVKTITECLNRE